MARQRVAFALAGVAAGLALAATMLLAFAPVAYQATVSEPAGSSGEAARTVSRSAIAVLGWRVLPILAVPTVATVYLWARVGWRRHPAPQTKLLLWLIVLALLGYAALTATSFGVFFGPSTGFAVAAVLMVPSRGTQEILTTGQSRRRRSSSRQPTRSRARKRRR